MKTTLPTLENLQESYFQSQVKKTCESIRANFSFDEHVAISFVPLIFVGIAFHYADKCRKMAAQERISVLTKVGRAYDELKAGYIRRISQDLDLDHQRKIQSEVDRLMTENAINFQIMWFSVNSELKKKYPDCIYEPLRTDALCGMVIIDLLFEYNREVDKMLEERLGKIKQCPKEPVMESLRILLSAYAGNIEAFDIKDNNVQLAKQIILRRAKEMQYIITPNE